MRPFFRRYCGCEKAWRGQRGGRASRGKFSEREKTGARCRRAPPGKIRTVKRIYRHRPKAIEGESNSFIFSFPGVTRKGTRRTTETKKRTTNANARGKRGRGSFPETHLEHAGGASDLVHVLHDVLARGLEVRDEGRLVGDGLEVVQGERNAHGVRHGDQVQHGVGGPAEGDDDDHGVLEGGAKFLAAAGTGVVRFLWRLVEEQRKNGAKNMDAVPLTALVLKRSFYPPKAKNSPPSKNRG